MSSKQLTRAEAIEQGYTHCIRSGGYFYQPIVNLNPVDFEEDMFHICEKEGEVLGIPVAAIKEFIEDYFSDMAESMGVDEDRLLTQEIKQMPIEPFKALADNVNKVAGRYKWLDSTGIELLP